MKLVRRESETEALQDWLTARPGTPLVTSELARVEVVRAARRVNDRAAGTARALFGYLDTIALDRTVQDVACEIAGPALRTLDALHLASAIVLGEDLSVFVAYDHRLIDAATRAGLETATPKPQPPRAEQ